MLDVLGDVGDQALLHLQLVRVLMRDPGELRQTQNPVRRGRYAMEMLQENGSRWCSHSDQTTMSEISTICPTFSSGKTVSTVPGSYVVNSRHQRANRAGACPADPRVGVLPYLQQ